MNMLSELKSDGAALESASCWRARLRSRMLRALRTVLTEIGKSAESGDYYVYFNQPRELHRTNTRQMWLGGMTLWPERLWHDKSEFAAFAMEHESRKSRDETLSRLILPK